MPLMIYLLFGKYGKNLIVDVSFMEIFGILKLSFDLDWEMMGL